MNHEIGINFGLKGADQVASQLDRIGGGFDKLHNEVQRASTDFGGKFRGMADHVSSMSRSVVGSLTLAKAAVAAFVAQKLIHAPGEFMKMSGDLGRNQDFLRMYEADEAAIKRFKHTASDLNKTLAGFDKSDWFDAMWNIQSIHSSDTPEKINAVGKSIAYLGAALKTSSIEASNYYKTMQQSFYNRLSDDKKKTFEMDVLGMTKQILSISGAVPHDVMMAIKQAGSLYAEINRPMEAAFADLAMVTPQMGAERGGSALRMMMGRGGQSFAKLHEAVQSIKYERMLGKRIEDMTDEEQKKFKIGKEWDTAKSERRGGELWTKNPAQYWKEIGQMINIIKRDGGDWLGKLAEKGFGAEQFQAALIMADAHISGRYEKTYKMVRDKSGQMVMVEVENSQKSASAREKLLEQSMHGLHQHIARTFDPIYIGALDSMSGIINKIDALWEEHAGTISKNLGYVWEGLKESISGAFRGFTDAEGPIQRIIKALNSGTSDQWRQIGKDIGDYLIPKVNSLVQSIESLAKNLEKILGLADQTKQVEEKKKSIIAPNPKVAAAATAAVGGKFFGTPGAIAGGYLGYTNPNLLYGALGVGGAIATIAGLTAIGPAAIATAGTMYGLNKLNEALPETTRTRRRVYPLDMEGQYDPNFRSQSLPEKQEVSVQVAPTSVNLDGRTIAEVVYDYIKTWITDENARRHGTSNDFYTNEAPF